MVKLRNLKSEKPWAKLRISRKEYEQKRPWENSGLTREQWEEMILLFPEETIDGIYRDAEADLLVNAIFGSSADAH